MIDYQFFQGLNENNHYGWPIWVEIVTKISHVMVVFNSSVNYFVYWLKDRLMKNNLTRINTTYCKNHYSSSRKTITDFQKTGETDTKFECTSLVKFGDGFSDV